MYQPLLRPAFFFLLMCFPVALCAQNSPPGPADKSNLGIVIGSILDADNSKAIAGANLRMVLLSDSSVQRNQQSLKDGDFFF